ncbi:MAG: hypothetical protein A2Z83_03460 [Omnitrophica bacterium GWA2_52_8]|nr:MAG: hypothetical protein A2Z83_03460 [Omnitrophica bacterium GWA2_52_8]
MLVPGIHEIVPARLSLRLIRLARRFPCLLRAGVLRRSGEEKEFSPLTIPFSLSAEGRIRQRCLADGMQKGEDEGWNIFFN